MVDNTSQAKEPFSGAARQAEPLIVATTPAVYHTVTGSFENDFLWRVEIKFHNMTEKMCGYRL